MKSADLNSLLAVVRRTNYKSRNKSPEQTLTVNAKTYTVTYTCAVTRAPNLELACKLIAETFRCTMHLVSPQELLYPTVVSNKWSFRSSSRKLKTLESRKIEMMFKHTLLLFFVTLKFITEGASWLTASAMSP